MMDSSTPPQLTLANGSSVTVTEIRQALKEGKARLIHNHHPQFGVITGLDLSGCDTDTRDDCQSVWDEVWTTIPGGLIECIKYAK